MSQRSDVLLNGPVVLSICPSCDSSLVFTAHGVTETMYCPSCDEFYRERRLEERNR